MTERSSSRAPGTCLMQKIFDQMVNGYFILSCFAQRLHWFTIYANHDNDPFSAGHHGTQLKSAGFVLTQIQWFPTDIYNCSHTCVNYTLFLADVDCWCVITTWITARFPPCLRRRSRTRESDNTLKTAIRWRCSKSSTTRIFADVNAYFRETNSYNFFLVVYTPFDRTV